MASIIKSLAVDGVFGRRICLLSPARSEYYYVDVTNCQRLGKKVVLYGGFEAETFRIKVAFEERPELVWTLVANTVTHPVLNACTYEIHMEGEGNEDDMYVIKEEPYV